MGLMAGSGAVVDGGNLKLDLIKETHKLKQS